MKTCDEIRVDNLLLLISEAGGEVALAEKYGCTPAYIKQMARGYKDSKSGSNKGIGDNSARRLESSTGKPRGWLDHDHSGQQIGEIAIQAATLINEMSKSEQLEMLHFLRVSKLRKQHLGSNEEQATADHPYDATAPDRHGH